MIISTVNESPKELGHQAKYPLSSAIVACCRHRLKLTPLKFCAVTSKPFDGYFPTKVKDRFASNGAQLGPPKPPCVLPLKLTINSRDDTSNASEEPGTWQEKFAADCIMMLAPYVLLPSGNHSPVTPVSPPQSTAKLILLIAIAVLGTAAMFPVQSFADCTIVTLLPTQQHCGPWTQHTQTIKAPQYV